MRFRHSCTLHPRPSATVPDDPSSSLVVLLQAEFDVIEDRMLRVGHVSTGLFIWRALNETIVRMKLSSLVQAVQPATPEEEDTDVA